MQLRLQLHVQRPRKQIQQLDVLTKKKTIGIVFLKHLGLDEGIKHFAPQIRILRQKLPNGQLPTSKIAHPCTAVQTVDSAARRPRTAKKHFFYIYKNVGIKNSGLPLGLAIFNYKHLSLCKTTTYIFKF